MTSSAISEPHYFPCVEYLFLVRPFSVLVLDLDVHFRKSSYLNRANISTANKVMALTVPVAKGRHNHGPVRDVRIYHDEPWQKKHFTALVSAYGGSRYFQYYRDDIEAIWKKKYVFLADLIIETTALLVRLLVPGLALEVNETMSLREDITALPNLKPTERHTFNHASYFQVFDYKFSFQNNLSGLDLLFNLGPDAAAYLSSLHAN